MKNITLLNVYGKKNIGDEAINQMALHLVDKAFGKDATISAICVDAQHTIDANEINRKKITSPYGYVINEGGTKLSTAQKVWRFSEVISVSIVLALLGLASDQFLPRRGKYTYILTLKKSDLVLNMGGGYLRTKTPYSDYFGLLTTLLPIYIAKLFGKPMIFLPMSFGNFASPLQERFAFAALSNSTFFARDEISLKRIEGMPGFRTSQIKLLYAPDLALLNPYQTKYTAAQKRKNKYVVLSARKWLSEKKQDHYEKSLAQLVDYLSTKYKLKTVFIPMASNSIEDNDLDVAAKIRSALQRKSSFSVAKIDSPQEVMKLLDNAAMAICTRMHSAILSSLTLTPFITIEYEHKTLGFMKLLSLADFNIHIERVTLKELQNRTDRILGNEKNYVHFISNLKEKKKSYIKYNKVLIHTIQNTSK